jgi:hypothetical protein
MTLLIINIKQTLTIMKKIILSVCILTLASSANGQELTDDVIMDCLMGLEYRIPAWCVEAEEKDER